MTRSVEVYTLKDARNRHNVHYNETAETMDRLGTKSLTWALVKADDYEWYFVSFSFDAIMDNNAEEHYENQARDFVRYVKRRPH